MTPRHRLDTLGRWGSRRHSGFAPSPRGYTQDVASHSLPPVLGVRGELRWMSPGTSTGAPSGVSRPGCTPFSRGRGVFCLVQRRFLGRSNPAYFSVLVGVAFVPPPVYGGWTPRSPRRPRCPHRAPPTVARRPPPPRGPSSQADLCTPRAPPKPKMRRNGHRLVTTSHHNSIALRLRLLLPPTPSSFRTPSVVPFSSPGASPHLSTPTPPEDPVHSHIPPGDWALGGLSGLAARTAEVEDVRRGS